MVGLRCPSTASSGRRSYGARRAACAAIVTKRKADDAVTASAVRPGGTRPFMPPMRLSIFIMPPPFIFFIMSRICSYCLSRRLTSWTWTPAPAAMRRLRVALSSSGLRRSSGVIEQMMPSMRLTSRSARSMSAWPALTAICCGSLSMRPERPPIFFICEICSEVVQVEGVAERTLSASFAPRRRRRLLDLLDQGDDVAHAQHAPGVALGVEHPSPSIFSLVPANLIGTPATCRTDSAAPPRVAVGLGEHDAGQRQRVLGRPWRC